ncbi:inosine-uridine preferring nucleoside hydrolase [gamma proteobacterium NOR5-3]|jgi:inosine-uridine nucleoside N-ribohydrolase|nr:inosine-uridine preferring nucleoside hydrolase [gamma proteobacterium NOR5-3]
MKRVIFDTDIGIDDAMALLFLHYAPGLRIEAITTVSGNASIANTTRNACYVRERFGIDTPVFRGASGPIGPALGQGHPDFVHGKNGLGDISFSEPVQGAELQSAPEAIVELAEAYPGEITVVAVGRLSNLSKALDLCPRLPELIKEVVVMGGVFMRRGHQGNVSPVAEANMAGDPAAADRVFNSGLDVTVVGLDVTAETIMDESFISTLREQAGDAGAFIHDITRFYFDFYEGINGQRSCPIHDSSAVAYLLAPQHYQVETGPTRVVCEGVAMGQTILGLHPERYASDAWLERPSCRICTAVDAEAVKALYLETLSLAGQ